jgi:hypothetical protein
VRPTLASGEHATLPTIDREGEWTLAHPSAHDRVSWPTKGPDAKAVVSFRNEAGPNSIQRSEYLIGGWESHTHSNIGGSHSAYNLTGRAMGSS